MANLTGAWSTNMGMPPTMAVPQSSSPTPTPMGSTPPTQAQTPQFGDIKKLLTPSSGISPETQSVLDIINKQRDYYAGLGASAAQGLSLARGQAGSSTEQFGVQQAINQANLSAMNATGSLLGQDVQNQLAMKQQLGQLTSDEIASMRNMGLSQQYLGLQQNLGQQGINQGYANIDASKNIAEQQARNQLLTGGMQLLGGGLLGNGLFGGGGMFGTGNRGNFGGNGNGFLGGTGSLFNMNGLGTLGSDVGSSGAGASGIPLTSAGTGASGFGAGAIPLAGLGAMELANQGQKYGGTVGSFIANPVGAQLNLAKSALSSGGNAVSNAVSSVGKSVSSVFRF